MAVSKIKADQVIFENKASDPSSVEGGIYYNSISKVLKFYNGTTWVSM